MVKWYGTMRDFESIVVGSQVGYSRNLVQFRPVRHRTDECERDAPPMQCDNAVTHLRQIFRHTTVKVHRGHHITGPTSPIDIVTHDELFGIQQIQQPGVVIVSSIRRFAWRWTCEKDRIVRTLQATMQPRSRATTLCCVR
jgi:hypothetical protein